MKGGRHPRPRGSYDCKSQCRLWKDEAVRFVKRLINSPFKVSGPAGQTAEEPLEGSKV